MWRTVLCSPWRSEWEEKNWFWFKQPHCHLFGHKNRHLVNLEPTENGISGVWINILRPILYIQVLVMSYSTFSANFWVTLGFLEGKMGQKIESKAPLNSVTILYKEAQHKITSFIGNFYLMSTIVTGTI